jgi:hypothetical protein
LNGKFVQFTQVVGQKGVRPTCLSFEPALESSALIV